MRTWRMWLGPAAITIRTSIDLSATADLPGDRPGASLYQLTGVPADTGQEPTLEVALSEGGQAGLWMDAASGNVRLRSPAADLSADDLLFLAYVMLESRLHRHGIITLHAAAAERDGLAVVLLGHSGAGKTTTALRLCRDHGFALLGNDLVVVGGPDAPQVHAGTHNVRLRHSSVAASMPELLHLFPAACADPWRAKIDLWPEDLGIRAGGVPSEVGLIVFVHADPAYRTVASAVGDDLVHRLNLYENALRYIRAGSTPWLVGERRDFGHFVPSFDNLPAHQARTVTLQRLLGLSRYVAGPPADVAGSIARTLRSPASAMQGGKP